METSESRGTFQVSKARSDNMTRYDDLINESKENIPKLSGVTGPTVGVLIMIVNELRKLNDNLEKMTKRIQSDII